MTFWCHNCEGWKFECSCRERGKIKNLESELATVKGQLREALEYKTMWQEIAGKANLKELVKKAEMADKAVEVIRFYGDINNCEVCRVTHIDFEKFPSMSGGLYMTGRRAREFLTKHQLNSED